MRPQDYSEIPENRYGIAAGTVLIPTDLPITGEGVSSMDFVIEQGGNRDTFIFLLGVREARSASGAKVSFIEGIFLSERGRGFHATWGVEQLVAEVDLGGWRVVTTREVLANAPWIRRIEDRMNRGDLAD